MRLPPVEGSFGGILAWHREYRDRLDRHGFEVLGHVVPDPDCGGATVWLARKRAG